jgi:hypothetical protein
MCSCAQHSYLQFRPAKLRIDARNRYPGYIRNLEGTVACADRRIRSRCASPGEILRCLPKLERASSPVVVSKMSSVSSRLAMKSASVRSYVDVTVSFLLPEENPAEALGLLSGLDLHRCAYSAVSSFDCLSISNSATVHSNCAGLHRKVQAVRASIVFASSGVTFSTVWRMTVGYFSIRTHTAK